MMALLDLLEALPLDINLSYPMKYSSLPMPYMHEISNNNKAEGILMTLAEHHFYLFIFCDDSYGNYMNPHSFSPQYKEH